MADKRDPSAALVLHRQGIEQRSHRVLESHYQGLWFTLARTHWNSLALVPADEGESAAGVATALADVGRRLRRTPVTFFVVAGSIDYASAGRFVSAVSGKGASPDEPPASRVIVSVPPVVVEPLALAITDAADAVAICVRKGSTHLESAERTIQLVGRERIVGCILS